MENVISFPAVGTYEYNSERLGRYVDKLIDRMEYEEANAVITAHDLYYRDLIDIDWDPRTGEPIFVRKGNERKTRS